MKCLSECRLKLSVYHKLLSKLHGFPFINLSLLDYPHATQLGA